MTNLNLTPRAQKLIKEALNLATKLNHHRTNLGHVFVSFFNGEFNQIIDAFNHFEIDYEKIREDSIKIIDHFYQSNFSDKKIDKRRKYSPEFKKLLAFSHQLSTKYDHKYVGLEHIFVSLFENPDDFLIKIIDHIDINYDSIIDFLEKKLEDDDLLRIEDEHLESEEVSGVSQFNPSKYKNLNSYAINLNAQVSEETKSPLHIDADLIKKISEILCRKNKNNPLIIGEAGVGKTALVESLAQAIVTNQCSDFLVMKNIYSLDVATIIAGCKYRGEFEQKIKQLIAEISNDPFVILFIDEIHTIVGAGNPENGMDVANILKPYLARGEITCIGATTFDEYKKTIEKDPALSRRFQLIKIEEPSKDEVFKLIKNIKSFYEDFHFIKFSDDVIRFVIESSDKYLEGRFPDKALDIIDQVGAKIKLKKVTKSQKMILMEHKIKSLISKKDKIAPSSFNNKIAKVLQSYQDEAQNIVDKLNSSKYRIKSSDILEVISDKTNIPLSELKQNDSQKIKKIKNTLLKQVVGQQEPIEEIYKCLLRAQSGFRNVNSPIASILFAGPTGVGKTMTAKIIANSLFLSKNNFINIDLSEYSDKTSVNKLIGSNPGYIGYEKGGILTEKVKRNPHSLILLDEIQKAHEDVLFLLLQILEEGKISDSSGFSIDFSSTIIIMTTNTGSYDLLAPVIGFVKGNESKNSKNDILKAVKKNFPADFLNRLDEIISFNPLNEKNIKIIIEKQLLVIKDKLKDKNISVSYGKNLVNFIFEKIKFTNFGARQVLKTTQREIETLIAEKLSNRKKIHNLKICVSNNNISVT